MYKLRQNINFILFMTFVFYGCTGNEDVNSNLNSSDLNSNAIQDNSQNNNSSNDITNSDTFNNSDNLVQNNDSNDLNNQHNSNNELNNTNLNSNDVGNNNYTNNNQSNSIINNSNTNNNSNDNSNNSNDISNSDSNGSIENSNNNSNNNSDVTPPSSSAENIINNTNYIIITNQLMKGAFLKLADWKNQLGLSAEVVTIDWIEQNMAGRDSAEKLRNYLKEQYSNGLKYVLLGGDYPELPIRKVNTTFFGFNEDSASQLYFSDMNGTWDDDNDGSYGESYGDNVDLTAEIGVGRAPVSTSYQANIFVDKVLEHEKNNQNTTPNALFITDIATQLGGYEFDAALSLNRIADGTFPAEFQANDKKLYVHYESYNDADPNTLQSQIDALSEGYMYVTHFGHGSHNALNMDMGIDEVSALTNSLNPIYVSCACESGDFEALDAVSEHLMVNQNGGAVAYIGNTATGLGSGGGSQFIEGFYKSIFEHGFKKIGDAFNNARILLSEDRRVLDSGNRWTQMVVVLFGDPALTLWTTSSDILSVNHPDKIISDELFEVNVTNSAGNTVENAIVTIYYRDSFLYKQTTDSSGKVFFELNGNSISNIKLTVSAENHNPYEATINF